MTDETTTTTPAPIVPCVCPEFEDLADLVASYRETMRRLSHEAAAARREVGRLLDVACRAVADRKAAEFERDEALRRADEATRRWTVAEAGRLDAESRLDGMRRERASSPRGDAPGGDPGPEPSPGLGPLQRALGCADAD